jgi:hypothetical protein
MTTPSQTSGEAGEGGGGVPTGSPLVRMVGSIGGGSSARVDAEKNPNAVKVRTAGNRKESNLVRRGISTSCITLSRRGWGTNLESSNSNLVEILKDVLNRVLATISNWHDFLSAGG